MKKLLAILLSLLILLSLSACGRRTEAQTPPEEEIELPPVSTPVQYLFDNSGVEPQGTLLGSLDCRAEYRSVYSDIREVPDRGSDTRRFTLYTDGLAMWNGFLVILQSTPEGHSTEDDEAYTEYAVIRADHFAAGEGVKDAKMQSDWSWESFTRDLNGALIELTVGRKGDKAELAFTATTAAGEVHQLSCKDIAIPADGPLYYCLSVEHACLDLLEEGPIE